MPTSCSFGIATLRTRSAPRSPGAVHGEEKCRETDVQHLPQAVIRGVKHQSVLFVKFFLFFCRVECKGCWDV